MKLASAPVWLHVPGLWGGARAFCGEEPGRGKVGENGQKEEEKEEEDRLQEEEEEAKAEDGVQGGRRRNEGKSSRSVFPR